MDTETVVNDKAVNLFSLFAASSTLICCALPALFVMLGAGATFASLISSAPFLITLSIYKITITGFACLMLIFAGYINWYTARLPCPVDPDLGRACLKTRRNSRRLYFCSVAVFLFATVFTYVIPRFL